MTAKSRKMVKCTCSSFEFGTWTGEVPEGADPGDYYETTTTGCVESTWNTFAMGHDAKLVGFLVRAELAGQEIRHGSTTFPGAVQAARAISDRLADKAQGQLDKARTRKPRKAKATKPGLQAIIEAEVEAIEAPAPTVEAQIKVGRWVYPAVIDRATGRATYTNKKGAEITVARDQYTEQS